MCSFAAWRISSNDEGGPSDERSVLDRLSLAYSSILLYRGRDAIPRYWEHAHKDIKRGLHRSGDQAFDDSFPVGRAERQIFQDVIEQTLGKDEKRFRVIRAIRIENSVVWGRYQKRAGKIMRRRGDCTYIGRGPPSTVRTFEGVPGLSEFTQDLDEDLCECYLWHGCTPQGALSIAHGGFAVDHQSKAGKRFGYGGYFAEDPCLADKYAGAGEGIYSDCFAMLLCRVVLGRQYHVREYKAEDTTDKAKDRYDSTLAEPKGSFTREFIAFGSDQIYPEYALVYERRAADEVEYDEVRRNLGAAGSDDTDDEDEHSGRPPYWFNSGTQGFFHDLCPAVTFEPVIQALMEDTWAKAFTLNRKGSRSGLALEADDPLGDLPEGLQVLKVLRIEDSQLWSEFSAGRGQIRDACEEHDEDIAIHPSVKTVSKLPAFAQERLDSGINEVYLWHGSSPAKVKEVAYSGFTQVFFVKDRGDFGPGAYFTEDAAHADEFSEDDKDGYYKGYYAMMLCRVVLGKPQYVDAPDFQAHTCVGQGREFDSTVGKVSASSGYRFRQFMVATRAQVYPEYAIIYERLHRDHRER
mmetsp:Transcript_12840/g.35925  ORF Transcript_12840/g.35925 Transcript_12840/m.35925 type:complete len:578 (-) Transcript_12840:234-1967(-)